MNKLAIFFFCVQACLQNVFSQCNSHAAVAADVGLGVPYGLGASLAYDGLGWGASNIYRGGYPDISYPGVPYPAAELASYGGIGEGNVAVAGELPVAGSTVITGQVPVMGAVKFGGDIPAVGTVTITGKCACGCGAPYDYLY